VGISYHVAWDELSRQQLAQRSREKSPALEETSAELQNALERPSYVQRGHSSHDKAPLTQASAQSILCKGKAEAGRPLPSSARPRGCIKTSFLTLRVMHTRGNK